jgi:hypothetical protein
MSNQGVEKRKKRSKLFITNFLFGIFCVSAAAIFCVIKSSKDQQEEANKLFIALPEM